MDSRYTPLHHAADTGDKDMVEFLLEHGALVNASLVGNQTPLHLASKNNDFNVVKCLLEAKANVNAKISSEMLEYEDFTNEDIIALESIDGFTALHLAAATGSNETVKLLLEHGALVNRDFVPTSTPLHLACKYNHLSVAKYLLEAGACVDDEDSQSNYEYTPLHYAAEVGSKDIVELLLEHEAFVDVCNLKEETPLHLASKNNHLSVVKCLLEAEADVNVHAHVSYSGYTPLHYAAEAGSKDMIEVLLEHGALVNDIALYRGTPLHLACKKNDLSTVKYLLEAKADVNAEERPNGRSEYTPLHYAAEAGFKDMAGLLLQHGALINKNQYDGTPLHLAIKNKQFCMVKYLLEANADINAQHWRSGYRPLHYATIASFTSMVELLLDNGALVNAISINGCTPLHIACEFKHFNTATLLLERGAQVDLENYRNETALDLACSCGFASIAELLLKFDAKPNMLRIIPKTNNVFIPLPDEELFDVLLSYGAALTVPPPSSRALIRHMVKLKISINAGLHYPSSFPLEELNDSEYTLDCEEEISRMMSEKIGESNISLFNILASDVHKVAVLTKNREVMRVFEEGNIDEIYPIYRKELRRRFQNGLERSQLLKKAVDFIHSVCLELPDEICEKILGYLRHKDLVIFKRINA